MNIRFSGIIVAAMLVVPNISAGAELSMFERVLVPIAVRETPGAGGSLWTSTFTVLHSTAPVSVLGYDTGGDPIGLSIGSAYRPPLYYSGTAQPAGVLVYVSRDAGPATSYALRVRDVNHDDSDGGTTIPVIR